MSEPAEIHDRVVRLENEVAEIRYLANKSDRDVSDVQAALRGQMGILNAIGETQREHGLLLARHTRELTRLDERVASLDGRVERLEHKVDTGFAEIRTEMGTGFAEIRTEMGTGFAEIRVEMGTGFGILKAGQDHITRLLDHALQRPDGPDDAADGPRGSGPPPADLGEETP